MQDRDRVGETEIIEDTVVKGTPLKLSFGINVMNQDGASCMTKDIMEPLTVHVIVG